MNTQLLCVGLTGDPRVSRLTEKEINGLFNVVTQLHDHSAKIPAQPIFWYRIPEDEIEPRRWSN